ncbi:MAG: helix-turn-helix domain-containing protein [Synechococcus sp. ArSW.bin.68]
MIQFDSVFSSCHGLQELFKPLSPDLVSLQLSRGPLHGRLRSYRQGAIRFNLLETNQSLFLSGTRRSKACTLAVPLDDVVATSPYRAQGIPVLWPALLGYNQHLTSFDLKVPAGARLATIVIGKEALLQHLTRLGARQLTLARWKSTNQLELLPELRQALLDQLSKLIRGEKNSWNQEEPDQLIETVIRCFEETHARTTHIANRESRHEAAIDLLHWCASNPMKTVTVEELSSELFQSRTSLFRGSREHFEQTPLGLQRSIRMDRVRQLLLEPARRDSLGLIGVGDSAASMGFSSRGHFARRYLEQYEEQPQTTLAESLQHTI